MTQASLELSLCFFLFRLRRPDGLPFILTERAKLGTPGAARWPSERGSISPAGWLVDFLGLGRPQNGATVLLLRSLCNHNKGVHQKNEIPISMCWLQFQEPTRKLQLLRGEPSDP